MDKVDLKSVLSSYAKLVEDLDPLLFLARDTELQQSIIPSIYEFIEQSDAVREAAIAGQNEKKANVLLGLRTLAQSTIAELQCYIFLKDNEPNHAWDKLIDAQSGIEAAMRADESFSYLALKGRRLRDLEYFLFPPQNFLSAGLFVSKQLCSLCEADYSECDHLAGKPYCGKFCVVVLKEVTADHVAFVDEPANRRCRVVSFTVPGGVRNKMSWVVSPKLDTKDSDNLESEEGIVAETVIATTEDFGGEWPKEIAQLPEKKKSE